MPCQPFRLSQTLGRQVVTAATTRATTAIAASPATVAVAAPRRALLSRVRAFTTSPLTRYTPDTSLHQPQAPVAAAPPPPPGTASAVSVLLASDLAETLLPTTTTTTTTPAVVRSTNGHPAVYATVLLHGRPYLVTPGDRVRLPFRMQGVRPGDALLLDRVSVVGSRNVTAVAQTGDSSTGKTAAATPGGGSPGQGYVPGVAVRAVVLGIETEPMRIMVKTKRRNRRAQRVRSKHFFTVLRIQDIMLGNSI